jgi:hypothetical protein
MQYRVGPWAEVKNSTFHFSAKTYKVTIDDISMLQGQQMKLVGTQNVVISMLQGQQMKLVGTHCFNTNIHLFDSEFHEKNYESEISKENLSSIFKIFTIEQSYVKS